MDGDANGRADGNASRIKANMYVHSSPPKFLTPPPRPGPPAHQWSSPLIVPVLGEYGENPNPRIFIWQAWTWSRGVLRGREQLSRKRVSLRIGHPK